MWLDFSQDRTNQISIDSLSSLISGPLLFVRFHHRIEHIIYMKSRCAGFMIFFRESIVSEIELYRACNVLNQKFDFPK